MKKILVFLAFFLSVTGTALAEPFQLHSGILFGMDMKEVERIETKAGYNCEKSTGNWFGDTDGSIWVATRDFNLAGIGGSIYYDFDSNSHELNMCLYSFTDLDDKTSKRLVEAYTKKYGNTVAKGEDYIDIPGKAHDAIDGLTNKANSGLYTVTLKKFYQWIYQLDDGSAVDIMLIEWNEAWNRMPWESKTIPDRLALYVTYSYRSPEEMNLFYNNIQQKEDTLYSDI